MHLGLGNSTGARRRTRAADDGPRPGPVSRDSYRAIETQKKQDEGGRVIQALEGAKNGEFAVEVQPYPDLRRGLR